MSGAGARAVVQGNHSPWDPSSCSPGKVMGRGLVSMAARAPQLLLQVCAAGFRSGPGWRRGREPAGHPAAGGRGDGATGGRGGAVQCCPRVPRHPCWEPPQPQHPEQRLHQQGSVHPPAAPPSPIGHRVWQFSRAVPMAMPGPPLLRVHPGSAPASVPCRRNLLCSQYRAPGGAR